MSVTCPNCAIRYASELPVCPWCGQSRQEVPANADAATTDSAANEGPPTHTESRPAPPPPPPASKSSVTYDLSEIPGPDEDWEPVDTWIEGTAEPAAVEPEESPLRRWAIVGGAVVALLAFGAFLAEVLPVDIGSSDPEPVPTAAATATTLPPATTTPPVTTSPPPATTVAPTTVAPVAAIEPIGDAISAGDLRLDEDGLGVLDFGSDGTETVGRLVATFGQPDADTGVRAAPAEAGGGFCEGELQRQVRWGSLSVYLSVADDGSQTMASAQVDAADATDPDPGASIESLSGLGVGDTVADLRTVYDGFDIEVSGGVWDLRAGSDGRLLLWGTTSGGASDAENVLTSLRSSLRCGT